MKKTVLILAVLLCLTLLPPPPALAVDAKDLVVLELSGLNDYDVSALGCGVLEIYDYYNNKCSGLADIYSNIITMTDYKISRMINDELIVLFGNESWGIIDINGNMVQPVEFYDAGGDIMTPQYSDGLACVDIYNKDDSYKCGYIDAKGHIAIPLIYDSAWQFSEGLAVVAQDNKWGFINSKGKIVIPLVYDRVWQFREGLAPVEKDGKWGFIDATGSIRILLEYDDVKNFNAGLAPAQKDGKWGFIDSKGRVVIPFEYDDFRSSWPDAINPWPLAVEKDGKCGFIDKKGAVVTPLEYDYTNRYGDGPAVVVKDRKAGIIDDNGNIVQPLEYDSMLPIEGFLWMEKDEQYCIVDRSGEILLPLESGYKPVTIDLWDIHNGYAAVAKEGKYGYIDSNGSIVVPAEYDAANYFSSDGIVQVSKNRKYGYVDGKGNVVVPLVYNWVDYWFVGGMAVVRKGAKQWVIVDTTVVNVDKSASYTTLDEHLAILKEEDAEKEEEQKKKAEAAMHFALLFAVRNIKAATLAKAEISMAEAFNTTAEAASESAAGIIDETTPPNKEAKPTPQKLLFALLAVGVILLCGVAVFLVRRQRKEP